jgi:hypothetical protein
MSYIKDAIIKLEMPMNFKEKYQKMLITEDGFDLSALNAKELDYFRMCYPNNGVLFLSSEPGLAKTSITKSIAKKIKKVEIIKNLDGSIDFEKSGKLLGESLFYIDLRLSYLDETDVGVYPNKTMLEVIENGESVMRSFLDHIVPVWAQKANNRPEKKSGLPYCGTLVHFEELNRALLPVRNAALQLLLERCIGFDFQFNDDVFMIASGNLGAEDGTDVEEFDAALNGRLIHIRHTMNLNEWLEYYAYEHIHPAIITFLKVHPSSYYINSQLRDLNDKSFGNPRSWTYLSNFITKNFGKNCDPEIWISIVTRLGYGYIGATNLDFCRYIEDVMKLDIQMIIDDYENIKLTYFELSRDQKAGLLYQLKEFEFSSFTDDQVNNVKLFLLDCNDDEISAYIIHIIDVEILNTKVVGDKAEINEMISTFFDDDRFKKYVEEVVKFL